MNGYVDLMTVQLLCEERLRTRRREPVDRSPSRATRSCMAAERRAGDTSGLIHALQSATRAVASYLV
jgi:hypothetical protein